MSFDIQCVLLCTALNCVTSCFNWACSSVDVNFHRQVHGGTSANDIVQKVKKAVERARRNRTEYPGLQTVLFFDEANTTEDIGLIKEIMCDHTVKGSPLDGLHHLNMIAACNSYRKYVHVLPIS